jgi:cell division protein ZapA (FtsZ GTPase activity inhibitor)
LSEPKLTAVTIYGQTYRLRAENPERLRAAAEMVDARMRELAASSGTIDTSRLVLLVSLDLADDLLQARLTRQQLDGRVRQLAKQLEDELQRPGPDGREL